MSQDLERLSGRMLRGIRRGTAGVRVYALAISG
jgi:hypothetical protein